MLAILLAVGNHFLAFTKLAMAALPLYNKFRTVSMALVILQFTMPLLGFLAYLKSMVTPAGRDAVHFAFVMNRE